MFAQLHTTFITPAEREFLYVLYDNLPYLAKVFEDINARARRNAPIHQRGADSPVRPQEGRAGRTEPRYATTQGRPDNAARPAKPDGQQTSAARALVTGNLSFSQGTAQPAGKSVPVARVQQIAQQVLEKLGIADVVRIEAFGNPADAKLPVPTGLVPAGVLLNDGRIVLFADNIASDIDAFRVVFHELFHLGLSKTVGQNAYVQQMLKFKLDPLVNQYAQRWKQSQDGVNRKGTMPVNNYEALAVEESLADIAEDLATDKLGSKTPIDT